MHADPKIWADVRHRALVKGESIRSIARADGFSRNTVRKMLRQSQPVPFQRKSAQTLISGFEPLIDSIMLENDARPQCERRSVAAIFRLLKADYGYRGGYGSIHRYCRSVQAPLVSIDVRIAGDAAQIDTLTIVRQTRTYRLSAETVRGSSRIGLRLHRDRQSERTAEVARWIDRLRADRPESPLRGDPTSVGRLLPCVHGQGSRKRNQALSVLAHEQGFPIRTIAAHLGMSRNTVRRHIRSYIDGGTEKLLAPMTRKPAGIDREKLKEAVFRLLHVV